MQMTEENIYRLLEQAPVARLATVDADGMPYVVPVHYVYTGGKIYIHGKLSGRKMDNLAHDPRVCLEVDEMDGLVLAEQPNPCRTNTAYRSVIVRGEAAVPEQMGEKLSALRAIADKYTPQLRDIPIPPAAAAKTAVIEITICDITGKYYK
ncbi:MAG: pyridoxamine 5'-phosphate oxidase family protein [Intestinibacillus sp.]